MYQLQKRGARTGSPQLFDNTERDSAAPVHCNSGGLIGRQTIIILVHHLKISRWHESLIWGLPSSHGRDPQLVAGLETVVIAHSGSVDAHPPATDCTIDMTLGSTLQC